MLYLRLLAGLTSLRLNLCASQDCSIGPVGTLEMNSMKSGSLSGLDKAGQNGDRDGDVADSNQDGDDLGDALQPRSVHGMAEAERLKHAPEAMIEVIAK